MVSRQDRDYARTEVVDEVLPLLKLQTQVRVMAREDEIACANINWRKEKEIERKATKALAKSSEPVDNHNVETNSCKEKGNAKPASKRSGSKRKRAENK